MEKLNSSRIRTTYCGLPRDKEARSAYLPYAKNIVKLPTFIVFVNGREKGRIVETPGRTLEEDLAVLMLG